MRLLLASLALCAWLLPAPASAADPCPALRTQTGSPDTATRIAAYACDANTAWFRPFIDLDGRVNGVRTYEAEASALANSIQAWQQVAIYWNDSGTLPMARAGASECAYIATSRYPSPSCRAFIIDTPWSAAFISWVMRRAGLPGFNGSASHLNYVRDAYRNPLTSAYQVQDPRSGKPEPGDMLCYVRAASRIYGFSDLAGLLSSPNGEGLGMHCDIVVGAQPGNAAYLVGGNVAQAVTLRMLRLAPNGYFASLPTRTGSDPACSPDTPQGCNSNLQDWSIMLKLRPADQLAQLPPPYVPPATVVPQLPSQQCCTVCVVGSGIPRCPAGNTSPVPPVPQGSDPARQVPVMPAAEPAPAPAPAPKPTGTAPR